MLTAPTDAGGQIVQGERILASGDEIVVGPLTIVITITSRVVARPRIESTRYLEERLTAEVDRGQAYHRRFGLVMLRLGGVPEAADDASDRICAAPGVREPAAPLCRPARLVACPSRRSTDCFYGVFHCVPGAGLAGWRRFFPYG